MTDIDVKEVALTIKVSKHNVSIDPFARVVFRDRRNQITNKLWGNITNIKDKTYKHNSEMRIITIRTDAGLDFDLIIKKTP